MAFLLRVFPAQYFNILVLPNNEDKYCYLQFNVTRKLRKSVWKFESPDRSERVFGNCPPATTRLNVYSWSIVNSNSDSEHRVHFFMPWELPENLLKIYLKLLMSNYWGGGGGGGGGGGVHPVHTHPNRNDPAHF
jgi:hypothetical protein